MVGNVTFGHDFSAVNDDGVTIYYNITGSSTVEVTHYGETVATYSGSVSIPEYVDYGSTYRVTGIGEDAFYNSYITSVDIPNSVESIGDNAFYNCRYLNSITIPYSVTSIGFWAFSYCEDLTYIRVEEGNSVYDSREDCNAIIETASNTLVVGCQTTEIPNSVQTIGDNAFHGCPGLTSITIPSSIESIGWSAFDSCNNLAAVYISDLSAWVSISFDGYSSNPLYSAHHLFIDGVEVKDLVIPDYIKSIGNYAFYGCTGLTSVTIPNSVTSIGESSFGYCSCLANIVVEEGNNFYDSRENCNAIIRTADNTLIAGCQNSSIPNSIQSIGDYAFYDCASLTSIDIPNSVTSLGNYAFYNCSGLTSVTIPNSVTSLGNYAFCNCSGLNSVTVPYSITEIGEGAFYGTAWYNNQPNGLVYAGNVAYKYKGTMPSGTSLTIKDGTLGIAKSAFSFCSGLTSVTIPNSVTKIGSSAFYGCSNLASIDIPNSVTSIGTSAFSETAWYNNQPEGVIYVGKLVYKYKGTMPSGTSLTIKDGTLGIVGFAFDECYGLTSVTIPNSITFIGTAAFQECYNMSSVHISNLAAWCKISFDSNPLSYAHHLYLNGEEVKELVIPNSITSIGNSTFSGCTGLTSIEIPNSVTSIGNSAFSYCSSLTSIEIPNSVTSIGNYAFYSCSGLTSIEIPNSVTSIGESAFSRCRGLTSIEIPNSVTSISSSVFSYCSGLTSIEIPNSVTWIGDGAFEYCSGLNSISIPQSVTSIGESSFNGCRGLTTVIIPNTVASIGSWAFENCNSLSVVHWTPCYNKYPNIDLSSLCLHSPSRTLYLYYDGKNEMMVDFYASLFKPYYKEIIVSDLPSYIHFADATVKSICVANWDTNQDNELDEDEAAAIFDIGTVFKNTDITSFDELRYFTGLTAINDSSFNNCSALTSIIIPKSVASLSSSAFDGCTALNNINVSESSNYTLINGVVYDKNVTKIIIYPQGNTSTTYSYPSTITALGGIRNNPFLERIIVPKLSSTPTIYSYTFDAGPNLLSVEFAESIGSYYIRDGVVYSKSAYDGSISLVFCPRGKTSLTVTPDVERLIVDGFSGQSKLQNLVIESSERDLILLNESSGGNSSNIHYFHSPLSYVYLGRELLIGISDSTVFAGNPTLESVVIGENWKSIDKSFFSGCSSLTNIEIPNSITSVGEGAFNGTQWYNNQPDGLVYVGKVAYKYKGTMSSDTSIIIYEGIESISSAAFSGCTGLTSVEIPNSVTSIGNYAFYGCTNLTEIHWRPNANTNLSSSLTNAYLTSTSRTLYLYKDDDNSNMVSSLVSSLSSKFKEIIVVAETVLFADATVKSICVANWDTNHDGELDEDEAAAVTDLGTVFSNTDITSFDELRYFTGLTTVSGFSGCSSLTSVTLPSSLTSISSSAFNACTALQSINVSGSGNYTSIDGVLYDKDVTKIVYYPLGKTSTTYSYPSTITAFGGISNNPYIERIIVPELSSTPSVSYYSFNVGPNLLSVEFEGTIGSYYTQDGIVYSKYKDDDENVITLVFCPRGKTSLTITPDVNYLSVEGFSYESKLERLIIEPSNRYLTLSCGDDLRSHVFHAPLSYVSIGRPLSLQSSYYYGTVYSNYVFANIPTLETVIIGENVKSIESSLFTDCTGLTNVTLPETITSVGMHAFDNTPWLESIPLEDGVKYDKHIALQYVYSEETKNVRLKEGTSVVADGLFLGSQVESIAFPIGVTRLEYMFGGCNNLKRIVLPNSITELGYGMGHGAVKNFHVPNSVTSIGLHSIGNLGNSSDTIVIEDGFKKVNIPSRSVDDGYVDGAFSGVKNMYVGRDMTCWASSYSAEFFHPSWGTNTQLKELTFGPLVKRPFDMYALRGCDNVTKVTSLAKTPFQSPSFYTIANTAVLYVPLGSKEKYAKEDGWNRFKQIEEVTSVTITMDDTEKVYAGDFDLDFSNVEGLKAYTVSDFDAATSTLALKPVQTVPAGKGVILKGTKGTYTVPCANLDEPMEDALCGTISGQFIRKEQGDSINFMFDQEEHVFKAVDRVYGGQLYRNEAYLSLPSSTVSDDAVIATVINMKLGDTNADGKVSITDAVAIVNYILNYPSDIFVYEVADVNRDNKVTITDAVAIVNMILEGLNEANKRERETLPRIADTLDPE